MSDQASVGAPASKKGPVVRALVVLLLAVVAIVVYSFSGKKKIITFGHITNYDKPLPYVFNSQFQNDLTNFVLSDKREVGVVFGPSGVGKTRGLIQFAKMLNSNNSLVLNFDFKKVSQYVSPRDLLRYIKLCVFKSFAEIGGKIHKLKDVLPHAQDVAGALRNTTDIEKGTSRFKSQAVASLAKLFAKIVVEFGNSPALAFRVFFETLEALSPVVRPVIIINDIETLSTEKTKHFWKAVTEFLSDDGNVTFIFEVSDPSALFDGRIPIGHDMFKMIEVGPMEKGPAVRQLVKKEHAFNERDFDELWGAFGGHGRSITVAHEFLTGGESLKGSVEKIIQMNKRKIALATDAEVGFLKKILESRSELFHNDPVSASRLMQLGITTLTNRTSVVINDKGMGRAVREFVQLN